MTEKRDHQTNPPLLLLNRELSLLDFQLRVLEEAQDESNPLLERVKFLSIFGSNMDEFFMVRVSGLRKQVDANLNEISPDGLTPREQLAAIRKRSMELYKQAQHCYRADLLPKLNKAGVHILDYKNLNKTQHEKVDEYFCNVVFPILTPLVLDPGHPFPHISNLSLNLAIVIRDTNGVEKFARLKVPATLPPLLPIKRSSGSTRKDGTVTHHHYFVWLDQVIIANLGLLFPGMEVIEAHPFRIIRDADIEIQELEAGDLLESMQMSIRRRKFGTVVMVAIHDNMPRYIRNLLIENLEINTTDMYVLNGLLGLANLWQVFTSVERYDLKYPFYKAVIPMPLREINLANEFFDVIRTENILIHHPYDSYSVVTDFLNAAARDPQVLAIKQTLYRVGQNSPIVEALLEAAERGKQVAVLVELKARFDEESNIGWARTLERAGVHVVYGVMGLKTHCKAALVVRKEGEGVRRYLHLATGNYNPTTATIYEDIGLFTCDETLAADVSDLFNYLTGYSTMQDYRKLLVAPVNLRQRLEALIRREMKHVQNGKEGYIIIKVNSIVDPQMIQLLYEASQAGVKIDLLVRGMCCLVPGVKGVSENIQVISVVGRYLEHSRIFYFKNDDKEQIYLGSADLMTRNINNRVETIFPIESEKDIRYLRDQVLENYLKDNSSARIMQREGNYIRLHPNSDKVRVNVQEWLMQNPRGNAV
ncbi:MAG TPA: polyphosphate kinase 1 [Anaerolineales bacterium]|nr:polyphosphate kinase 1 [Anaerolineales bacterium]